MVLINQCYPGIFYSEFPIKTLTHNNLNYKKNVKLTVESILKNRDLFPVIYDYVLKTKREI